MKFRLTALLVTIALMWGGFASNSFAYHTAQPEMAGMSVEHPINMEMSSMPDCPSHNASKMKMDASKCMVACYGLVSPVVFEPAQFALRQGAFTESIPAHGSQSLASRISGVPTPPPNFA